jgi:hypothetical protein
MQRDEAADALDLHHRCVRPIRVNAAMESQRLAMIPAGGSYVLAKEEPKSGLNKRLKRR